MKVCIVGSRALELDGNVVQVLLDELAQLGERGFTEILIRKPLHRSRRPFEALVGQLGGVLGFTVTEYIPDVGGRAQVFFRDIEMVQHSDEVAAYFPEDHEMTGGTAHVVEKALDQGKTVRAYVMIDGRPVLVGSDN